MKILFICTAHNSLSQRLHLTLSASHQVTVEYALSEASMLDAVALAKPDLVICPFLTTFVPKQIYDNFLTLIIHPGPPGDAGPSSIDWLILGDDGSAEDPMQQLKQLDEDTGSPGRTHWGVTVLQAIEKFDAGPVWAFQQFPVNIDQPGLTKSSLYRGEVTQAAVTATLAAIQRIETATLTGPTTRQNLQSKPEYAKLSVADGMPFGGGITHARPLLKASLGSFDIARHTARYISRRIRGGDSQPGVLSRIFGPNLYLYGGLVDDTLDHVEPTRLGSTGTGILAIRDNAICVATADKESIWITHIRQPKLKNDSALWPKVPAVSGLAQLDALDADFITSLRQEDPVGFSHAVGETYQEVWVQFEDDERGNKTAYLCFDHYNGAMSTEQCSKMIEAMNYILEKANLDGSIRALVLMGGSYFSNGIALNVIEAAADPAQESWRNINRIDDVVQYLLHEFPSRNILTVAAIRDNAAAGGVALATACDFVIAGANVTLNPAYRAIGLYGSEYHTLSYYGRCGEANAKKLLNAMLPMSPLQAREIGLVDFVFPDTGAALEDHIRTHMSFILNDGVARKGPWKRNVDLSKPSLALARANELAEMSKDFWSPRSVRYHTRRFDFVRKSKATSTPLRFATHRRGKALSDEEEMPEFDNVKAYQRRAEQELLAKLRASVWTEVSTTLEDWSSEGDQDPTRKQLHLLVTPKTLRMPPTPVDKGCLFPCHYQPVEPLLTPPESPMPLAWPRVNKES